MGLFDELFTLVSLIFSSKLGFLYHKKKEKFRRKRPYKLQKNLQDFDHINNKIKEFILKI
jgi:hypothetical protein